jgi:hypothetical protein
MLAHLVPPCQIEGSLFRTAWLAKQARKIDPKSTNRKFQIENESVVFEYKILHCKI